MINCEFTLHEKVELVRIFYPNNLIDKDYLSQLPLNVTANYFDIAFTNIENTLNLIVKHFENSSNTFTSIYLSEISEQNQQ